MLVEQLVSERDHLLVELLPPIALVAASAPFPPESRRPPHKRGLRGRGGGVWSGARQRRRGWGAGRCPEVRRRRARRPRIDPRLGAGWSGRRRATRSTRRHVVHHRPRSAVQTSGRRLADVSEESTGGPCVRAFGGARRLLADREEDRVRRRGCLRAAPHRGRSLSPPARRFWADTSRRTANESDHRVGVGELVAEARSSSRPDDHRSASTGFSRLPRPSISTRTVSPGLR
jgi:hypothetical protein